MASAGVASLPKRGELTREQCWDIESIFASDDDWQAAYARLAEQLGNLEQYRGRLGESAATLLTALRQRDDFQAALYRLAVYANMRRSEDATNADAAALADRAAGLLARAAAAMAFYEPELLALDRSVRERFLEESGDLARYRHYFAKLDRLRGHIRSPEVEETLAQARDVTASFGAIRGALENADLDLGTIADEQGREVRLGQGNLLRYLRSDDRAVRQAAWESSADAYWRTRHTFAGTLIGTFKRDVFYARARRYGSSLEAALAPHAIPTEVFHNLIATVWKNLPTWHRYFAVRRRVLGLDTLHGWDITAPLRRDEPRVPFEQGVELIAASLAPLGEEYVNTVRQGIADRWVDRFANIGKGGGAFSIGGPGIHPFISMSYQDDLPSVSTLTHELGHSLHSYHTWRTQPTVYGRYSMFAAEAASNMHQALLGAYLLNNNPDPAFQIAVIEERMGNHLRYLFTMPILARFELACHERIERGEALTAEGMTELLAGFYREGYGGEVAIDTPRMGITWARFGHFFVSFYVFQYATGIAAAALARQIREEGEPATRRYIEFLKTGDAAFPIDALQAAGVDLRDPAPVQAAFDILAGYVDRLDALTK